MKHFDPNTQLPFELKISFDKLLKYYEDLKQTGDDFEKAKAERILRLQEPHSMLRDGFDDESTLKEHQELITTILQDTFSDALTNNEIKAVSLPFQNIIFNSSERFKKIVKAAGDGFELKIKNLPESDLYIIACTIILNFHYGYDLSFKRPFLYEIPDEKGVMRYYKILYNADFTEVVPKKNTPKVTQDDYEELLDNFDNLDLWKEKFPPNSYEFKGFVISNMFDVTDDQSISNIKSTLIGEAKRKDKSFMSDFQNIFSSFLGIKDLKVGFSIYNKEDDSFERVYGEGIESFLLCDQDHLSCKNALCDWSYDLIINQKQFFSVSNVEKSCVDKEEMPHVSILNKQGIKSAILAPIADKDEVLGVLEIASEKPHVLNSIVANKLIDVMPFIVSSVKRSKREEENLIEAVIQQECTSIHPSVSWKFKKAAKQFLIDQHNNEGNAMFQKISFEKVYPLFGQIDVKGSSEARNLTTQKDLLLQLSFANKILEDIPEHLNMPIYDQVRFQIDSYIKEIETDFKVDSEQQIAAFFHKELDALFKFLLAKHSELKESIEDYFSKIDSSLGMIYYYRKNYDDTIALINKKMSSMLDEKQVDAQQMYPHFFERYKTDGVEHNMYIGEAITKEDSFDNIYLYNLRLWQLQVMCEMENEFYNNQHEYPMSLDVTSMILVFNQPLSIRFRMDEKRFDVDGTYNARYEVVKKRVDKAFVKGTTDRITHKGKITIVYSQKEDEQEYMRYVKFLQSKHVLGDEVEILELEDLQSVTGLRAIRASILYTDKEDQKFYTYDDLMATLKQ